MFNLCTFTPVDCKANCIEVVQACSCITGNNEIVKTAYQVLDLVSNTRPKCASVRGMYVKQAYDTQAVLTVAAGVFFILGMVGVMAWCARYAPEEIPVEAPSADKKGK